MTPSFTVTLVPGDGIGSEIAAALVKVFQAAEVPVTWDSYNSPTDNPGTLSAIVTSARNHKLMLKGPLTPISGVDCSKDLTLRILFDLYANVRPFKTITGIASRWSEVDLLLIRENIEGEPTAIQYDERKKVETVKIVTWEAVSRLAEFAFHAAEQRHRHDLVVAHKADVMNKADGLFLRCCREVSKKHPTVVYREMLVNDCCMELVLEPTRFDVLLLQYFTGDIVGGLCAGLIGGAGLTPSASIGERCAVFEVMHGCAAEIVGKGIANPTALILSGVLLLRHVKLEKESDRIEQAVRAVIRRQETTTPDIGGRATTGEFTDAIIAALHEPVMESVQIP